MRRIVIWLASTVTIVVLLFGYHTSTNDTPTAAGTSISSKTAAGSSDTKSYTGALTQTRWGPVEVKITVADGKITAVDVPEYPQGNDRDVEINDRALPTLVEETLSAQSAEIDMVSGATVTSEGYLQSLQSAMDKAGL